jgi:hypothetical protein
MILFSQDKEIVFKITNAILLLWLIAAVAITVSNGIDLLMKEPQRTYTYEEYEVSNCLYFKEDTTLTEEEIDARCLLNYNEQKFYQDNISYNKSRNLYISLANAVIVGGVLFFINKSKKEA